MLSLLLMQKIAELFVYLFIGFLIVKLKLLKSEHSLVISKLSLFVVFPCTLISIFQQEISSELVQTLLYTTLLALIVNLVLIGLGAIFGRICHLSVEEQTSVVYPNSGNLIIPMIAYILGDEWLLFTAPYLAIQGVLMFTHAKGMYQKERPDLKSLLKNTTVIFTLIGLILMLAGIHLPPIVGNVMDEMKNMIGPLSMIISGMLIAGTTAKEVFRHKRIWLVIALRLVVFPLILLFGMRLIMPDGVAHRMFEINLIVLLAGIAPSASAMVQFAQVYDADEHYASAINIMTTILCIVTMPLMVMIYQFLFEG